MVLCDIFRINFSQSVRMRIVRDRIAVADVALAANLRLGLIEIPRSAHWSVARLL